MDPDMIRLAQEQMSRIPPEQLMQMQQQMMSNPELMRMASEGMKNIQYEDLKAAADQMKNIPPEQIADFSARMSRASPAELAAMRARTEAQLSYEVQGALALKNKGNQLHGSGMYSEAAEYYTRAKRNLAGLGTQDATNLRITCSLNLMSCYLKTQQFDLAISEGSEVLKGDPKNLKALYRRGQAYKELGRFKLAIKDLSQAVDISPDDEIVAETLRQVRELELTSQEEDEDEDAIGPKIEEVTEREAEMLIASQQERSAKTNSYQASISGTGDQVRMGDMSQRHPVLPDDETFAESLNILKQNPDMIRNMHSLMENVDPEQIAALSGGGMTPEMAKFAADMVKQMTPDDLQRMVGTADLMRSQGNTETQSGLGTVASMSTSQHPPSNSGSTRENLSSSRAKDEDSSEELLQEATNVASQRSLPSMPNITPEMQDQMQKQMKDPAMKQMIATFMKSMTPESMASMSEQMGMKLTPEQAAEAQKAMADLSPEQLDRLMRWADRAQKVTHQISRAKNWILGRPGLILAILMLLAAIFLHYFGYIGK